MSVYTVLVNGVPQTVGGSTAAPSQSNVGYAVTSSGGVLEVFNLGNPAATNYERAFIRYNANFAEFGADNGGAGSIRNVRMISSAAVILNTAGSDRWQVDNTGVLRPNSSAVQFDVGSSNVPVGNLWLSPTKRLDFGQTASTFAQTATITNGPRAANPVAWVEVSFNAGNSTGRIPIW